MFRVEVPKESRKAVLREMAKVILDSEPLPPGEDKQKFCLDPPGRDILATPEEVAAAACGDCKKLCILAARRAIDQGAKHVELCMTVSADPEEHVFLRVDGKFRDPAREAGMPERTIGQYVAVTVWPRQPADAGGEIPMVIEPQKRASGDVFVADHHGRLKRASGGGAATTGFGGSMPYRREQGVVAAHQDLFGRMPFNAATGYISGWAADKRGGGAAGQVGVLTQNSSLFPLSPQVASPGAGNNQENDTIQAGATVRWLADGGVFDGHRWSQVQVVQGSTQHGGASEMGWANAGGATGWMWDEYVQWSTPSASRAPGRSAPQGGGLVPWVSTREGGKVIWNGRQWVPNTGTRGAAVPVPPRRMASLSERVSQPATALVAGKSTREGGNLVWDGKNWVKNYNANSPAGRANRVAYFARQNAVQAAGVAPGPTFVVHDGRGWRVDPNGTQTDLGVYQTNGLVLLNGVISRPLPDGSLVYVGSIPSQMVAGPTYPPPVASYVYGSDYMPSSLGYAVGSDAQPGFDPDLVAEAAYEGTQQGIYDLVSDAQSVDGGYDGGDYPDDGGDGGDY